MDPSNDVGFNEVYYSQSPIFLKNLRDSSVSLVGNTFDSNVGILGGVIHIDNQVGKNYNYS